MLIAYSSFANNGAPETLNGGNVLILYDEKFKTLTRVNIVKSNFTLGLGYGMALWYLNDTKTYVIIDNSNFLYNAVQYHGGGVYILLCSGNGSIEFHNCTIYNNTGKQYGGGVFISSDGGNNRIEFDNCTVYNNTAYYDGGGVCV